METCLLQRSRLHDARWLVTSWVRGQSFIISRDWSDEFKLKVDKLLRRQKFDVIHVLRPNMLQYVPDVTTGCVVLDTENVEAQIVRRTFERNPFSISGLVSLVESKRLKNYEAAACVRADLVLTVTDEDRSQLLSLAASLRRAGREPWIESVPIGVDTGYFGYCWHPEPEPRCVFVGTMYWPPNVDSVTHFSRDILPAIREQIPGFRFDIVGLKPAKTVVRLAKSVPGVHVSGSVEDVRPFMARSRVFVVPLRIGSGMRVKILNAMAVGVPVVTTSVGCEGIRGLIPVKQPISECDNSNANIWIADTAADFCSAVVQLIGDHKLAQTLSKNGRKLMETVYNWSVIRERILELYDRIGQYICSKV